MEQSNISRDHVAMEAMKVLMPYYLERKMTLKEKIKILLGLPVAVGSYDADMLAIEAYGIADAMIKAREYKQAD